MRRPLATLLVWKWDLLDRNREPPDQPRNLVQLLGILVLKGLRKPDEAFVIAHRGHVARHDRRHRPQESGQEIWHRITSTARIWRGGASSGNTSFWRSVHGAQGSPDRPARCQIAIPGSSKWATNPCAAASFRPLLIPRRSGLFRPLQGSEALLYAARCEQV